MLTTVFSKGMWGRKENNADYLSSAVMLTNFSNMHSYTNIWKSADKPSLSRLDWMHLLLPWQDLMQRFIMFCNSVDIWCQLMLRCWLFSPVTIFLFGTWCWLFPYRDVMLTISLGTRCCFFSLVTWCWLFFHSDLMLTIFPQGTWC